jgi:hypothetical protein
MRASFADRFVLGRQTAMVVVVQRI